MKTNLLGGSLFILVVATALSSGCSNSFSIPGTTIVSPTPTSSPQASANYSLTISTVRVIANGTGNAPPTASIYFDAVKSVAPISTYCALAGNTIGDLTCSCQYTWSEINTTVTPAVSISRKVLTKPTAIQSNLMACPVPDVYDLEIPSDTVVDITIVPDSKNKYADTLSLTPFHFTKNGNAITGSFQDSQGQLFDNVFHYSCYQAYQRGMSIRSKKYEQTAAPSPSPSPLYLVTTNQFCIDNIEGSSGEAECLPAPSKDFTAQTYYVDFYIRSSERGDINTFNTGMVCPRVNETLPNSPSGQVAVWPMDSSFALSLGPTSLFNQGIEANTKISNPNDPSAVSTTCSGVAGAAQNGPSTISSCLGYAAAVNADGSCPTFVDNNLVTRPMFRLRRYYAVYPRIFNSDGSIPTGALAVQTVNTIYVLDRPVANPSGGSPYSMLGPKPCPFAYYDHKLVLASPTPTYAGSNRSTWDGKNIDGIEFPRVDIVTDLNNLSCAAALPTVDPATLKWHFETVGSPARPHAYIRPVDPFLPHYEEDIDFKVCAPQAAPFRDAPLHFSRDPYTGNVAWCTESYPSQNPYIDLLDPNGARDIQTFTSHTDSGCTPSALTSTKPNRNNAHHLSPWNNTCDRTVQKEQFPITIKFPLLAPSSDIENASLGIQTDSSYMCLITNDNKSGKTNKNTPSSGCCTSQGSLPSSVSGASVSNPTTGAGGHLEPTASCGTPTY